ncbi:MAG TPA: diacylglycerol kinase family lipid kinase [Firmicutes bacterium]|nr:diacylglycerol kinase family lipid kinase [Bacillota bacterium]
MRYRIVVNPTAGRGAAGRRWPAVAAELDRLGLDYEPHFTVGPGDATEVARRAASEGFDAVVAAGGDGTLSEVVNGLVGTGRLLGILPMGSGNDFALAAGIGPGPFAAAQLLASPVPRLVDLGRVDGRYFINVASAGMDAEIARLMNEDLRYLRGTTAYLAATIATLFRFRPAPVRLELDGVVHELEAVLVAVANGQYYGGGMNITPRAVLDDGLLDVCAVGALGRLEFLRAFPSVFRGEHLSHPKISTFRARRVVLYPAGERPLLVQADGEIIGALPQEFVVEPAALTILGPPAAVQSGWTSAAVGA